MNESPGFFATLGQVLNSAATGWGYGQATRGISTGRQPGLEQFTDPTSPPKGAASQPGTVPNVVPSAWQQAMPFVIVGASLVGLALVVKMLFRK